MGNDGIRYGRQLRFLEIDEDVIKDLELPCTIAVYEDDILPAKISFDMQDIMEKAMEEEGVDVSACSIEVTYHEYDSVGEIKVPNDVIEKQAEKCLTIKRDKEDKDDDKKRINRQSRSKRTWREMGQLYGSDQR